MSRAYIALGSNMHFPVQQVRKAFDELDAIPRSRVTRRSSLYRTAPVGYDDQPDFINAVVEMETALPPQQLLDYLLAIENLHGRERPFPNAPRPLDLDLLLHGDTCMQTETLTLPHPRMHARGFVLLPLAEIAPDLVIPLPDLQDRTVTELAATCMDQGVTRLDS
ncbi:MAG TPA: 2-amino-4-hydroxy-6-hydroxymethyldihydropteridine diphosphokinase [Methylophilaceae bacterium]|jgi:2-amino-4-hydroxy-6-hydroxymethyldihydropteridine diphosphokinase